MVASCEKRTSHITKLLLSKRRKPCIFECFLCRCHLLLLVILLCSIQCREKVWRTTNLAV